MGFFSDLKEDLSQAVNELMPDELTEKAVEDEMSELLAAGSDDATVNSEKADEKETEDFSVELSLEEMLKNIDSIQLPEEEEEQQESVVSMDASLEAALAAALENIPDENGLVAAEGNASWFQAEPEKEAVIEKTLAEMLPEEAFVEGFEQADIVMELPSLEMTAVEDVTEMAPVTEPVMEMPVVEAPIVEESVIEEPILEEPAVAVYSAAEVEESAPEVEESAPETVETTDNEKANKGADKMDSYTSRQATDETAVITAGMQIKGDITSEGSVDVVGTVEGNIDIWGKLNITGHVNGNSNAAEIYAEGAKITGEIVSTGAVKIGNSSVIIGNITAKSAAIAGAVKGDIDAQGPVILDASAIVMGNIKSKSVQINNGAVIEGMCSQCYADVSPLSFFDEYKTEIKNSKKNK